MKKLCIIPLLLLLSTGCFRANSDAERVVTAERGELSVWAVYEGRLESRSIETVRSAGRGQNTIMYVIPEGTFARKGDVLAEFDCSDQESDYIKVKSEEELARLEMETLTEATHPLELNDLDIKILEQEVSYQQEKKYLEDSMELLEEGLVSEYEIRQQELKLEPIELKLTSLRTQLEAKKTKVHPAAVEKARMNLTAKEEQLKQLQEKLDECRVIASRDGVVIYTPAHVSGNWRTVRVGDTVWRNQQFMELQDMQDLVVQLEVPESELSRIAQGNDLYITPLAFPDMKINGAVETVGVMAKTINGKPQWQKYFDVVGGLKESPDTLRSGMSVKAHIQSYHKRDALLVPREAVTWEAGEPVCYIVRGGRTERNLVKLGMGNATHYEVHEGVSEGDRIRIQ